LSDTDGTCDGVDDDCDGTADDDLVIPDASKTLGLCAGSLKVCMGLDGWQDPIFEEIPGYEQTELSCDDEDNDCDGQVDEDLVGCCTGDEDDPPCNGCPSGTLVPEGWVCVPAGSYTMGSPDDEPGRYDNETQHQVTLTCGFLMKATEVTQAEWQAVMGSNPSYCVSCGGTCPVERVSWNKVVAYCNALSSSEGLERCYQDSGGADYDAADAAARVPPAWPQGLACLGYRLPTEAEWEYAARAGTQTAFYTGAITNAGNDCGDDPNLDLAGWYCGNAGGSIHPVGGKPANAWGLYDMLGNVWEWCWDWYGDYPGAVSDPLGPPAGSYRVTRGGSRNDYAVYARAANRSGYGPNGVSYNLGFRPVRSIP